MQALSRNILLLLVGASILVGPAPLFAQTEKAAKPGSEKKEPKKSSAGPFHGKLAAVDKAARTITVGKRTFQITGETKISKSGKAATLDQATVGEAVSGYVKPSEDGKLIATRLNLGPKGEPGAKSAHKKE